MAPFNYIEARNKKLAANNQALQEIGITKILPLPPVKAPKLKKATGVKKRQAKKDPPGPRRQSLRTQKIKATEEEKAVDAELEKAAKDAQAKEDRRRKHEDRRIKALNSVGGSLDDDSLTAELESLALSAKEYEMEWFKSDPPSYPDKESAAVLEEKLGKLEHRGTIKVTDARVYSLCFHPDPTKDIIISGDKDGSIGMWDATDTYEGYEGLEDKKGRSWYWNAHRRTVSVVKFSPVDAHHLYSSSYDCTLRRLNFETGISQEVLDGDRWDPLGDHLIHAFDFDPTGNTIWAVDNGGGMIHRDMREPLQTARRWTVDRAKIGGFSINPVNPNVAVTGHLKHEMRVWDLRKLMGTPDDDHPGAEYGDDFEDCVVATYDHTKACSSTYWDRSGTKILTTCYDDALRVFDVNPRKLDDLKKKPFKPTTSIEHNNQTGAYVSVFRAQWSTCPTLPLHIHVANMGRTVDVCSPYPSPRGADLVQLADDSITAVPAVTASHPTREGRYAGGNASGKVTFYAPPPEEFA